MTKRQIWFFLLVLGIALVVLDLALPGTEKRSHGPGGT